MVCYLPGTGTLAVIGLAVYLVWHKAIAHFLALAGTATEIALLLGTEAAVAIALIWTARMIRRRRAQAGACTTCRFRCQEALQDRPNLLVNRVDRRTTPPVAIRAAARTCHPAAPLLGPLRPPGRPAFTSRQSVPPAQVPSAASRPGTAPRPAPSSGLARSSGPARTARPAPAPRPAVPGEERWPLAPRNVARVPASLPVPPETVAFDGYVLTPDGVDGQPSAIEH